MSKPEVRKFMLMPPAEGLCQECAGDHTPDQPHNAHSLFYQTKFNMDHGRAPNWLDAMAHCSDELQAAWKHILKTDHGIDVDAGELYARKEGAA